jgi:tetratricopeptide (TPR) repeat protein
MGHTRLECIAQCNLGIALGELDQPEPARRAYEAALDGARRIGERRYEGQFLTYLGLLDARQGRQAQARLAFDGGEALLRQVADRISLGVLLCARAEACVLAGQAAQARSTLDEARSIAKEAQVGPESELGLALARVEALLAA